MDRNHVEEVKVASWWWWLTLTYNVAKHLAWCLKEWVPNYRGWFGAACQQSCRWPPQRMSMETMFGRCSRRWRASTSCWPHGRWRPAYGSTSWSSMRRWPMMHSSRNPARLHDRKLIVDIAILREALEDPQGHSYVRWVPGREVPCDSLTKWFGNDALLRVLQEGQWSLMDTDLAKDLREKVAMRKRLHKSQASTKGVLCWKEPNLSLAIEAIFGSPGVCVWKSGACAISVL